MGVREILGVSVVVAAVEWFFGDLVFTATLCAAEILGLFLDEENIGVTDAGAYREELAALAPLLGLERFDRRELNRGLGRLSSLTASCAA